ncbi:MAG: hypothetical protein ACJ763_13350 [Bdellovibrionia bacterium]
MRSFSTVLALLLIIAARPGAAIGSSNCVEDPSLQAEKSAELQKLASEDQEDRKGPVDSIDWKKVSPRDLQRRTQVAEIFAAGCFKDAKDYAAAALVYQHGDTADHAYQTFIWSKRAVQLGDGSRKWLMAAGLDRYLVRIGQKQLFGTQVRKDNGSPCWCLEPTEESFPDQLRVEYIKNTLSENWLMMSAFFNADKPSCKQTQFCHRDLKPSPAGTVPGFW